MCLRHTILPLGTHTRARNFRIPCMSRRIATLAIAIAMMGCIAVLDYAAGHEVDLWLLYLAPIGLVSFVLGARYGYAMTLAAAMLLFLISKLHGPAWPTLGALLSERGTETSVYVVSVYLLGLLRLVVGGAHGASRLDTPTRMD